MERRGLGLNAALWDGQKTTGGCNGRDGTTKTSAKTAQGKVEPRRAAVRWRGWLRAGQEGATTAFCPSPVCPAPSGGPKGSGLTVGEPSQGGTIWNGGGVWGGREEPGVRTLLGAGGGATPWEKGLGTSRADQSASKAWVASRGSFGQWEGRTLRRFGGRKGKKSPTKQQSNPFGGLEDGEWASFMSCSRVCPVL